MTIPKEEQLSELRKAISSLEVGFSECSESDSVRISDSDFFCDDLATSGSFRVSGANLEDECSEKGPKEAYQRVIKLISIKDRPVSFVRERLLSEGFSEESSDYAICRAVDFGLLDDVRYAEALFRTRFRAGKGRRGIEQELLKLDISPDCIDIDAIISDFDNTEELDRALALLEKHPPRCKNVRDGAFRKLYQKGFSSDVSSRAAGIWASRLCS